MQVLWHNWSYLGALDAQECDWQEMHDKLMLQTNAKFPQTLVVGLDLEGMCSGQPGQNQGNKPTYPVVTKKALTLESIVKPALK